MPLATGKIRKILCILPCGTHLLNYFKFFLFAEDSILSTTIKPLLECDIVARYIDKELNIANMQKYVNRENVHYSRYAFAYTIRMHILLRNTSSFYCHDQQKAFDLLYSFFMAILKFI